VIIGLVYKVDAAHVGTHRHPDPEEIKKNLLTSADVSYLTSLDNGASMPVAVHYGPKSVSGTDIFSSIQETVKTVQACERCVQRQLSEKHIVTCKTANCFSTCDGCFTLKLPVCGSCKLKDQVSYIPSLRAYDDCLEKGMKCNRLAMINCCHRLRGM